MRGRHVAENTQEQARCGIDAAHAYPLWGAVFDRTQARLAAAAAAVEPGPTDVPAQSRRVEVWYAITS